MLYVYMASSVALVLGVLGYFLMRAQSSQVKLGVTARQKRYQIHEHALLELAQAQERGDLDRQTYEWELQQLNQRLVKEMSELAVTVEADEPVIVRSAQHWWSVFLLLPLCAGGLYFFLGQGVPDPARSLQETGDVGQFLDQIQSLEAKVKVDPENLAQQLMLARSYRVMGRYAESIIAYGIAWPLIRTDPTELALFAEVLALERGTFSGKPDELLAQAQALDANNLDVMMLVGQSALQQERYDEALAVLVPLKQALEAEGEDVDWLQSQIDSIEKAISN